MDAAPDAVLWDMDGTLVDTEPYWVQSEHEVVAKYGGTWSHELAMNVVGFDLLDAGRYIREHSGIDVEPSDIVEELLDRVVRRVEEAVPWRPGAVELLTGLRDEGVRCALVTMSYRRFVDPILAGLPEGAFEVVVTGDAVTQGKPHPEPYLKAAALLDVDPARTLAIEDSNTGTRSAESAGCTVLSSPITCPSWKVRAGSSSSRSKSSPRRRCPRSGSSTTGQVVREDRLGDPGTRSFIRGVTP